MEDTKRWQSVGEQKTYEASRSQGPCVKLGRDGLRLAPNRVSFDSGKAWTDHSLPRQRSFSLESVLPRLDSRTTRYRMHQQSLSPQMPGPEWKSAGSVFCRARPPDVLPPRCVFVSPPRSALLLLARLFPSSDALLPKI